MACISAQQHPVVSRRNKAFEHSFINEYGIQDPVTVNEHFELINALLDGWNADMFFPNIKDCSKYGQIFLNDNNYMHHRIKTEQATMKTFTAVRLVTKIISNQYAESYLYCHMTIYDAYIYVLEQREVYDDDGLEWF